MKSLQPHQEIWSRPWGATESEVRHLRLLPGALLKGGNIKVIYTLKRSRVGGPIQYPSLSLMLAELRQILEDRERREVPGKVWITVEAKEEEERHGS